ncbi:hypothetical protein VA249_31650 [Vibrio alfacsensis]|uniref:RbmA family biofilm matrix protein n=1 Tax=Vibrio alfacsensis TaxID=1074311 RepID=UPI001BEE008D|nr:RbmA protein [Vibrio alfacsensis]BBM66519.1 hypothetical protein VA249_31650 [Vibrio alfacsensis]
MDLSYKSFLATVILSTSSFTANAADNVDVAQFFALDISLNLNKEEVPSEGDYLVAEVGMKNVGETDANIKYWVSVDGPQGLSFPAKAVVSTNSSDFEVDADNVEEGASLNFKRGIWMRDYMSDGVYVVSVEGVNTDTGQKFQQSAQFTKGIDSDGGKKTSGLSIQSKLLSADHFGPGGGYALISMDIENTTSQPVEVEFWVNAVASNGFDIPVYSRVTKTIEPNETEMIVRGFWLDAAYPDGEYVITPQFIETGSGERVDFELNVFKGAL